MMGLEETERCLCTINVNKFRQHRISSMLLFFADGCWYYNDHCSFSEYIAFLEVALVVVLAG